MLLNDETISPPATPSDWRWPSKWPTLAQLAPVVIALGSSVLGRSVHLVWDYVGFGALTVWALWVSADIAFNPSRPRFPRRARTRRHVQAILIVIWVILVIWYIWP